MPYDKTRVPAYDDPNEVTIGSACDLITPNASADQVDRAGVYYKYFVAATSGDVTFVAYRNTDAQTQTMTVPAGLQLPGKIRRITASTATLHGWSD